jgi:isoleucyl-tRNA synthetase
MVENRLEWTISRQRRWGSPITFLRCTDCRDKGIVSHYPAVAGKVSQSEKKGREDFFERVYRLFRERGADAWYDDAFPASYFLRNSSSSPACSRCGGTSFEKLKDILDVWFDSGVSHAAVLRSGDYGLSDPYSATPPVPVMYLEGHDQHRGWFQSSLLTSVAMTGRAPYDIVATHGFLLDVDARKMSKSVGNVVSPQAVIQHDGADVLRLFFASSDYTDDVRFSKEIFARTADAYRKIRNTARFLLSNLFDFDPATNAVPDARLEPLDRWVLDAAARLTDDARAAYGAYEFHTVSRRLLEFVTTDLSAFWCDVRKDALYVLAANDAVRRSAQTAAFRLAEALAIALSPICPFTAEEIFESIPGNAGNPSALFLQSWASLTLPKISSNEREAWGRVVALRAEFLQALEPLRREGLVGSAAQAAAVVGRDAGLDEALRTLSLSEEKLAEVLAVPSLVRDAGAEGVLVRPAEGAKCPRCWQVRKDVEPGDDGICARCRRVVGE